MPFRSNLNRLVADHDRDRLSCEPGDDESSERPALPKEPVCPHCNLPMQWFNSALRPSNGKRIIVHSFQCSNCARVVQREEPFKAALRLVA